MRVRLTGLSPARQGGSQSAVSSVYAIHRQGGPELEAFFAESLTPLIPDADRRTNHAPTVCEIGHHDQAHGLSSRLHRGRAGQQDRR